MNDPGHDGHLPQFARLESARLIVSQAANGAAATYGLTLPEISYVLEGVLCDFRGSALALGAAQYERSVREDAETPKSRVVETSDGKGRVEVRPASEPETKAS